jgi:hypothetical protein
MPEGHAAGFLFSAMMSELVRMQDAPELHIIL